LRNNSENICEGRRGFLPYMDAPRAPSGRTRSSRVLASASGVRGSQHGRRPIAPWPVRGYRAGWNHLAASARRAGAAADAHDPDLRPSWDEDDHRRGWPRGFGSPHRGLPSHRRALCRIVVRAARALVRILPSEELDAKSLRLVSRACGWACAGPVRQSCAPRPTPTRTGPRGRGRAGFRCWPNTRS